MTCSSGLVSSLSLGFNSLSGSIPAELGDLRSLTSLYLNYNSLSGIPGELGNLANLNRLALSNNSLTGNIPAELGNLENLTSLDLSSNSLSGSIPAELGKLTNLTSLSLGFNSLSGSIPAELGDLRSLTSLYLNYNSLTGPMPQWLIDMEIPYVSVIKAFNSEVSNVFPIVAISEGSRTITDTDGAAGELVSFTGSAADDDGTIAATQWLVEGSEVATGLTATIALPNGSTVVTFKATDSDGATTSATVTITVEQQNLSPSVTISGGNRTISDTDGIAGETVSFKGAANDGDGTVATTQWFVDGSEVATGLIATIALPNGSTDITFKATDDDGASSTTTATITVASPIYEPTEDWSSPYNGVTPDLSYGLEFNNVGVLNSSDTTIYVCLRIFTDGLPSSVSGISQFDMGLKVVSLSDATVQITKFREFNAIGALNENAQSPDCSGKFETTTGIYTDIIAVGDGILETTWSLIDPTNLILKLDSFKELTAN